MVHAGSMPYSPYGAFELKSTYQRNVFVGVLCAATIGLVMGIILWVLEAPFDTVSIQPQPRAWDDGSPRPQPPPTLGGRAYGRPQHSTPTRGVIPNPVADDAMADIDTNVLIGPRNYQYGDMFDTSTGANLLIDTTTDDILPPPDSFIVLEIQPEIVHRVQLEYPAMARRAGMSGTVTLQVLVSKNGEPLKAIVARSSGWQILDEAALAGALKNTYKPGIQNGRPVACWISYRVDFSLERDN